MLDRPCSSEPGLVLGSIMAGLAYDRRPRPAPPAPAVHHRHRSTRGGPRGPQHFSRDHRALAADGLRRDRGNLNCSGCDESELPPADGFYATSRTAASIFVVPPGDPTGSDRPHLDGPPDSGPSGLSINEGAARAHPGPPLPLLRSGDGPADPRGRRPAIADVRVTSCPWSGSRTAPRLPAGRRAASSSDLEVRSWNSLTLDRLDLAVADDLGDHVAGRDPGGLGGGAALLDRADDQRPGGRPGGRAAWPARPSAAGLPGRSRRSPSSRARASRTGLSARRSSRCRRRPSRPGRG